MFFFHHNALDDFWVFLLLTLTFGETLFSSVLLVLMAKRQTPTFLAIKENELAKRTFYPARLGMCGIWMWMVSAAFFSLILICWMTLVPFKTRQVVELWIDFFSLWLYEDFHRQINKTESIERKTNRIFYSKSNISSLNLNKKRGKMPDKFKRSDELFFKANLFIKMTLKYVYVSLNMFACKFRR